MIIEKNYFGRTSDGKDVYTYTLINKNGMKVKISEFGGAVVSLLVPDKLDRVCDVVCGYDSLYDYENGDGYQGALIGRWGNRIGNARFTLDGKDYDLYKNDGGKHHLHGGKRGFSHKVWGSKVREDALVLTYISPDGEEGYPGTLEVTVEYSLDDENRFGIKYRATTDKRTPVNLTNHTYFNLGGFASGKIFDHVMFMDAVSFLETDKDLIPTGRILPVDNTPFDFRQPKTMGRDFNLDYEPMRLAGGYDHCLNFRESNEQPKITVHEPKSGRFMEVYTDMPCVQFYSGNFMKNPDHPFKGGYKQATQNAFCLETQKMPDSMNHENFTDCILSPGEVFESKTVYKFSIK